MEDAAARSDGAARTGAADDGGGDGDAASAGASVGDGEGVDGGDDFGVADADEIAEAGDTRAGLTGRWRRTVAVVVRVIAAVDVGNDATAAVCAGRGRGGGADA